MEQFVKDQIKYGLKYLPVNLIKYPFMKKSSTESEQLRQKGFICGVCHPGEYYKDIKEANIGWVRIDIPFPFDLNGQPTEAFVDFKNWCKKFTEHGIKVMAVTPYPREFFNRNIDVRTAEGEKKVRETAKYIINELKGCINGLQITNEMGIPHFILPLKSMDEAVRYIAIQLEEIYPIKGDIIIGYNSAGPQADLHSKMRPYLKYCDYVGIDIYIGCFFHGYLWMFDAMLDYLWALTKKPVILMEFGYISNGAPTTKKEKLKMLNKYGAKSEKDAKENIVAFVENMPDYMKRHIKNVCQNDESRYFNLIFKSDFRDHFYQQLPRLTKIPRYPHTNEGQARFYADILPRLYNKPYLAGAFVFQYYDSSPCHICGENNCPIETKWGLTDLEGKPKPSYFAVQSSFGKCK